jgi:YegS/Rv2252/BmrU family lipid kinase
MTPESAPSGQAGQIRRVREGPRRAAVIVHPLKHDDLGAFRAAVCQTMTDLGWLDPLWLETSASEAGQLLVEEAMRAGVDVVVASGGDGTVTACVAGLAGSGVPLGVLPAGTGNLLARNLGLPLSLGDALAVALTGTDRRLDVGLANGRPFAVMAGIGFDAEMLNDASEQMKKRVGWVAYVLSALRHFRERPMRLVVRTDSTSPQRCWASGLIIGNIGSLPGRIPLLPDAAPDDGLLDVALLTARGWLGWLRLAADLLLRRRTRRLRNLTCRELLVDLDDERPWEADGEVIGPTRQLRVSVQPGCLLVRVPSPAGI